MIANEAQRQFYLSVAGVRLWYARKPLPGAAPSPEFVFPEVPERRHQGAPATAEPRDRSPVAGSSDNARPSNLGNLQALMAETASRPVPADPGPKPVAEPEPADSEADAPEIQVGGDAVLRCHLQFWLGEKVLLVSDLSSQASLTLQQTLAENILRSLGEFKARTLGPLCWPVFNNPRVVGSRLRDLQSVLPLVLEPVGDQHIVLLGVPEAEEAGTGWLTASLGREPRLTFPHTLAALAADPARKRELWQHLKALAR